MFLLKRPTYLDIITLSVFTVLITLHPFFMHGKINIFEVGLYLPGIQSILNGEIPYRDFFHLRGPLELYMPAFLMKYFGIHITTLYSYFYFGTILCLILCILIAKEIFQTRFVLYLLTPILIARTFPRIVFTYWGGMRYAFGLLAIWFAIKYFKENNSKWMLGAGISSILALFTSIEIGAYSLAGIFAALVAAQVLKLQESKLILKSFGMYIVGVCVIAVPYGIYLIINSALIPYVDSVLTVVFKMEAIIDNHLVSTYPRNFIEAFLAMINPWHTNFKHMTPGYLYIFVLVYLCFRLKKKTFSVKDLAIICLGVYGFIMYNTGFRGLWAAQFEMALQPEKILLFFLLEQMFLYLMLKRNYYLDSSSGRLPGQGRMVNVVKIYGINFLIFAFFMSSIGYSIARYNHRFFAYKFVRAKISGKNTTHLTPLAKEGTRAVNIERAKGIIVPLDQAEELEQMEAFVKNHVPKDEELFTYPELGTYNFFFDRRSFGRFPIATFTWFNDQWHERFFSKLESSKPQRIIVEKDLPQRWKDVYLVFEPNRKKYNDVMDFILTHYDIEKETKLSYIYKLKLSGTGL